jgi:hypothetical protein
VATAAQDLRRSRNDRKRVLMTGTLVTPTGNQQVRIHDISPTGALVSTDSKLKAETELFLKKAPIWAAAWVAWTEEKNAGLKFYRELSQSEVDSIFRRD